MVVPSRSAISLEPAVQGAESVGVDHRAAPRARVTSDRTNSPTSGIRPSPEPSTTAAGVLAVGDDLLEGGGSRWPLSEPQPSDITSVSFASKIGSRSAGTATVA